MTNSWLSTVVVPPLNGVRPHDEQELLLAALVVERFLQLPKTGQNWPSTRLSVFKKLREVFYGFCVCN